MKSNVMIVEDSKSLAIQIRDWIVELGFGIYAIVNSGNLALNKIMTEKHPDIVLMDINLEDDTSGIEVVNRMHNKSVDIPIIYMSSTYNESLLAEIKATKPFNYLLKPFTKRDLHVAIEVAIELYAKEKELERHKNHLEELVEERTKELKLEIDRRAKTEEKLEELNKELKKKINKIHDSERNLRSLMEAIPDIVYKIDDNGRFIYINGAIKKIGYEPKDLIGEHFSKLILPDDIEKVSRDRVLPTILGVGGKDKEQPKLFDERRTGDRITQGLEMRIKPGDENNDILSEKHKEPLVVEVNSSGVYETCSTTNKDKFIGSLGIIKSDCVDLTGSVGVVRDITERKQLEEKLKNQNDFMYNIIESLNHPFYVIDISDYTIKLANSAASSERLSENAKCYEVSHGEISPCSDTHPCPIEEIKKTGKPVILRHTHKGGLGEEIQVEVNAYPVFDSKGDVVRIIEYCLDITDRLEKEKKLEQNYLFLESLINAVPNPIFFKDREGKYLGCNKAFKEFTGKPGNEIIGKTVYDMAPLKIAEEYYRKDRELLENPGTQSYEWVVNDSRGKRRDVIFNKATYEDTTGTVAGIIGIIVDITKRKKMEETLIELNKNLESRVKEEIDKRRQQEQLLIQQSKLASMGEMIGVIAHQWRQPLTALGLIVQDIKDAYNHGELDRKYLSNNVQEAVAQIHFMSKTIDDFRNFFKPTIEETYFPVDTAIKEVIALLSSQLGSADINVELVIEENVSLGIKGYLNEFMQVIMNLLHNSRDAVLELKNRRRQSYINKPITISVCNRGNKIVVSIGDHGGGIAKDIIDRIFEPYFTTKEEGKGTGVGLYMSKVIIENNMRGKLYVDNISDGALFTIELPPADKGSSSPGRSSEINIIKSL